MDEIIGFFKDTLEKFVIDDLQKYLTCNSYPNKFYIFSDYCLHDKNKTHDVLTCTIMPYSLNINAEKAIISSIASQDIKHVKIVNRDFINYLKKPNLFHISFLLGSRNFITKRDWITPREYIKKSIEKSMAEISKKNIL